MSNDKVRPYWHTDAKWIFGLLAAPALSVWLLGFGLYQLTTPTSAPRFVQAVVSSLINSSGSDVHVNTGQLSQQLVPLYNHGSQAVVTTLGKSAKLQQQSSQQLQILDIFTRDFHNKLGWGLVGWSAVTLLLLAGLTFFSHRFGKLVSLGVVLVAASVLGAILFLAFQSGAGTNGVRIATIGPAAIRLIGTAFLPAYLVTLATGAVLITTATILKLIYR